MRKGVRKGPMPKLAINNPPRQQQPQTSQITQRYGLSDNTTLTISGKEYPCTTANLEKISELGRGAYGVVDRMKHGGNGGSGIEMAVKRIRHTVNTTEQQRLLMDLEISIRSSSFPYTIDFYGALYEEGDVWICMELMKTSFDKFYMEVVNKSLVFPERVLSRIAFSVVTALEYLHTKLKVIHRDVKPSNILVNDDGIIKLCDFGISGQLVDSLAKTLNAGCKPYMAPERINPARGESGYDIRSDVWSLGITMAELSCLKFPYSSWTTPFDQLKAVVEEPSPTVPADKGYSDDLNSFLEVCLKKNYQDRPKYPELHDHVFVKTGEATEQSEVAEFVSAVLTTPDLA
jgi:mitogen-activated protein kinase kinase 3